MKCKCKQIRMFCLWVDFSWSAEIVCGSGSVAAPAVPTKGREGLRVVGPEAVLGDVIKNTCKTPDGFS